MLFKQLNSLCYLLCGATIILLTSACANHDKVLFNNSNSNGEIGILLDGNLSGNNVNDYTFTTGANGHVDPGVVVAGNHNEIIAFQSERPVNLVEASSWSNGNDHIATSFANEMGTEFHVYLLQGPFVDRNTQAIAACVKLSDIWKTERTGTQITTFQIHDKTSNPARAPFLNFTCAEAASIRAQMGFNANGINIYYVNRVNFGSGYATTNGVWCGNNTVVMGSNTSDHLAAHEIGHAFQLDHVNNLVADFDTTNVMHNASNNREYLTEGQNFRAHLEPASVINTTYNLRPGQTTRNCGNLSLVATDSCPAVQKRIWADGAFPAN